MFETQDEARLATESLGLTPPPETVEASTSIALNPEVLQADAIYSEIDDALQTQAKVSLIKGNLITSMESGQLTRGELTAYNYTLRSLSERTGLSQEDFYDEYDDDTPVDVAYDLTMESIGSILNSVGTRLLEAIQRYLAYLVNHLTTEATKRVNVERAVKALKIRLNEVSAVRPDYTFDTNVTGIADLTYDGKFDNRGVLTYPIKDAILVANVFNGGSAANKLFATKATAALNKWAARNETDTTDVSLNEIPQNGFKPWEPLTGLCLGGFSVSRDDGAHYTTPVITVDQITVKQRLDLPTLDQLSAANVQLGVLATKLSTLGECCEQTQRLVGEINKAVTGLQLNQAEPRISELSAVLVQSVLTYCRSFVLVNAWLMGMAETTAKVITNAVECYE